MTPRRAPDRTNRGGNPGAAESWEDEVAQLTFAQAQTALELALSRLQSEELEVEAMADLYRRALACSRRCEAILSQVEQDVRSIEPEELEAEG